MLRSLALVLVLVAATPLLAGETPPRALELNAAGAELYGRGDYEAAQGRFREAHTLAPEDPTIRRNLAYCLLRLGDQLLLRNDPGRALRDYGEAGSLIPADWAPRFREGLALFRARRDREAGTTLERALADHPARVDGWELLALVRYRLGENAAAIEAWELALRLEPKNERLKRDLERARREERVEGQLFLDQSTPHFAIKYDGARDAALGKRIGALLEEAYRGVGGLLGRYPSQELAVVVYPGQTFRALTGSHAWVGALYDGKIRIPAKGLAQAPPAALRRLLRHEYAHALLHALGGPKLPAWLQEGFAQLAEGRAAADALTELRRLGGEVPSLSELSQPFSKVADAKEAKRRYAAACLFFHHLVARHSMPAVAGAVEALGEGKSADAAWRGATTLTPAELHAEWLATLR